MTFVGTGDSHGLHENLEMHIKPYVSGGECGRGTVVKGMEMLMQAGECNILVGQAASRASPTMVKCLCNIEFLHVGGLYCMGGIGKGM